MCHVTTSRQIIYILGMYYLCENSLVFPFMQLLREQKSFMYILF